MVASLTQSNLGSRLLMAIGFYLLSIGRTDTLSQEGVVIPDHLQGGDFKLRFSEANALFNQKSHDLRFPRANALFNQKSHDLRFPRANALFNQKSHDLYLVGEAKTICTEPFRVNELLCRPKIYVFMTAHAPGGELFIADAFRSCKRQVQCTVLPTVQYAYCLSMRLDRGWIDETIQAAIAIFVEQRPCVINYHMTILNYENQYRDRKTSLLKKMIEQSERLLEYADQGVIEGKRVAKVNAEIDRLKALVANLKETRRQWMIALREARCK